MQYLTSEPIVVANLLERVSGPGLGGTATFVGSVRRSDDDGPVVGIEYSAYEEMANREFARIVAEAQRRWSDIRVQIRHRVGLVPTGEASVAVAVGAPHRAEAFDACRYVIEEVKRCVPVWKREFFNDGSRRWRENTPETAVTPQE